MPTRTRDTSDSEPKTDLDTHDDGSRLEGGEGFDFVQVNGSNTAGDDF